MCCCFLPLLPTFSRKYTTDFCLVSVLFCCTGEEAQVLDLRGPQSPTDLRSSVLAPRRGFFARGRSGGNVYTSPLSLTHTHVNATPTPQVIFVCSRKFTKDSGGDGSGGNRTRDRRRDGKQQPSHPLVYRGTLGSLFSGQTHQLRLNLTDS